jgi:CPA2 family monovalent cation:H+ antiporter-2
MFHSDLILTIVAAFVAAFFGGFIAVRLGLPPIVGYLVAGIVIGPYTPGGSADSSIATELSEIGVILLMFGVGLHFSIRELFAVGPIALQERSVRVRLPPSSGCCLASYGAGHLPKG